MVCHFTACILYRNFAVITVQFNTNRGSALNGNFVIAPNNIARPCGSKFIEETGCIFSFAGKQLRQFFTPNAACLVIYNAQIAGVGDKRNVVAGYVSRFNIAYAACIRVNNGVLHCIK